MVQMPTDILPLQGAGVSLHYEEGSRVGLVDSGGQGLQGEEVLSLGFVQLAIVWQLDMAANAGCRA